jgi:hypothetical protein
MSILALFTFGGLVMVLVWGALAAMSFWIWSATKAKASLLTMIGALCLVVPPLLFLLGVYSLDPELLLVAGSVLVVFGYYLTVKPTVDAKVKGMAHHEKKA